MFLFIVMQIEARAIALLGGEVNQMQMFQEKAWCLFWVEADGTRLGEASIHRFGRFFGAWGDWCWLPGAKRVAFWE